MAIPCEFALTAGGVIMWLASQEAHQTRSMFLHVTGAYIALAIITGLGDLALAPLPIESWVFAVALALATIAFWLWFYTRSNLRCSS